jgi:hypothetical protein
METTHFQGLFSAERKKKSGLIFQNIMPFWPFAAFSCLSWAFLALFVGGSRFDSFGLICRKTARFQIVTATHSVCASLLPTRFHSSSLEDFVLKLHIDCP